jgi:putative ubiquitin-RnfH superfamily antitoxin RatB of RatAB toxin-antitoxin module|tara:strand:- start:3731 stop:5140 length:1410 start_codon:yes stop_codon:yes gene_type:complete
MATWKKVIVSGSSADLLNVSASAGFKGNLVGNVTGTATQVGNSLTVDNSTIQLDSGTTYDGAAAKTVSLKDGGTTLAKQANMAADRIQGRANGAGTGVPQALTKTQVLTILNVEDGADVTDAAGIAALGAGIVSSSAQVSGLAGVNDSTITITAGDGLKTGGTFTLNDSSDREITLDIDVDVMAGAGLVADNTNEELDVNVDDSTIEISSDALRVKDSGITLAKIANIADDTILGNVSGGAAAPSALSKANVLTLLNVEDGADVTDAAGIRALGAGIISSSAQVDISSKTVAASQVTEISNLTAAEGAQLENIGTTTISAAQWGYLGGMDQNVKTNSNVNFNNLVVAGDLTVEGSRTELQVANLNVEDQYILLNSGSTSGDSGIIFGGSNTTANSGHALILDNSYNSNDGRLAVQVTDKAASNSDDFAAGTTGYYLAGVYEGTEANAATALADHPGNIRIESNEIYIYV